MEFKPVLYPPKNVMGSPFDHAVAPSPGPAVAVPPNPYGNDTEW